MEPAPKQTEQHSLEYWVKHLTQKEMPAFAHTARIIAGEASTDESTASRLAQLILQDPFMTVRLLKMANSPFFNPNRAPIKTISRAIVLLGFKAVRNMCMSISIIDTLIDGKEKKYVMSELAECFHAAVQAKEIAIKRHDKAPEEVFIASLLRNMGKFSFWTFAKKIDKKSCEKLDRSLQQPDVHDETAEKEHLGFSFHDLSAALNKEWKISPLIDEALSKKNSEDPRVVSVNLSHEIAHTSKKGWNSPEMDSLVKRLSEVLYMPIDRVKSMVRDNAENASKTLDSMGAAKVANLIMSERSEKRKKKSAKKAKDKLSSISNSSTDNSELQNIDLNSHFPEPDPGLQIQVLSDISQLMQQKPDINLMIEMILEGLHRGVGMDRTIFALLTPDKKKIKAKYSVGWDRQQLSQNFLFAINRKPGNIFDLALKKPGTLWGSSKPNHQLAKLIPPALLNLTGDTDFMIMAATIGNKPIGIFYADRKSSKRELDDNCFSSFNLFCQQANLALMNLSNK